jgi:hypothetical protein
MKTSGIVASGCVPASTGHTGSQSPATQAQPWHDLAGLLLHSAFEVQVATTHCSPTHRNPVAHSVETLHASPVPLPGFFGGRASLQAKSPKTDAKTASFASVFKGEPP